MSKDLTTGELGCESCLCYICKRNELHNNGYCYEHNCDKCQYGKDPYATCCNWTDGCYDYLEK